MRRALFVIMVLGCVALTPPERKVIIDAKSHLSEAMKERDAERAALMQAQRSADESALTTAETQSAAVTAAKLAAEEHKQLVIAVTQNKEMKPVYDQVRKWWGIGGILFGFTLLAKHLLILVAVLIVLWLILSVAMKLPILAPFQAIGGFMYRFIFHPRQPAPPL